MIIRHRLSPAAACVLVLLVGTSGSVALGAGASTLGLYTPLLTVPTGSAPGRVAVRPGGGFAVALPEEQKVKLYDAAGALEKTLSIGGRPLAVAVMNNGDLLVGDARLGEVARYGARGRKIGFLGRGPGEVKTPVDIDIDRVAQRIYVVDAAGHRVRVFNWDGRPLGAIGSPGKRPGEFDYPISVHVHAASGDVYVVDFKNRRIQVFDRQRRFVRLFGNPGSRAGQIFRPGGVAVDGQGRVLVSDMFQGWVQAFDAFGVFLGQCAGFGTGNGQLMNPVDVAVDEANRLLVASVTSNEVEVFKNLAGGKNPLPPNPVPVTREAVVTYLAPIFQAGTRQFEVFRVELWGGTVNQVVAASVKLNGTVPAVSVARAAGQAFGGHEGGSGGPAPALLDVAFLSRSLAPLARQAPGRWPVTLSGTLVGGGGFTGGTVIRIDRYKETGEIR